MYQSLLQDKAFFAFLFQCDQEMAREVQQGRCPHCGGPLHQANFPRKPRGGAIEIGSREALRLSFCCGRDGCRQRVTPPSLRFLGRRVFVAAAVVVIAAMRGANRTVLSRYVDVSCRTLRRWRRWWRDLFPQTRLWVATCGRLRRPIAADQLPGAMLAAFAGAGRDQLLAFLRWLAPLTGGSRLGTVAEGTACASSGTQRTPVASRE